MLYSVGVRVPPWAPLIQVNRLVFKGKYNELVSHQTMIQDTHRTQGLMQAIEKAVAPGDTVIDFGSGTGILAIKAAKCGAGKVIAIERNPITAKILKTNAQKNNVDIEVFVGNAKQFVEIYAGKFEAQVAISECIGDHIFENSMVIDFLTIAKTFNAKKRIPENFKLYTPNTYFNRKQTKFKLAKNNLLDKHGIDVNWLDEELFPNTMLDVAYFSEGNDTLDYYFEFKPYKNATLLYDFSTLDDMLAYSTDNTNITSTFTMPRQSQPGDYVMLYWDIDLYDNTPFTNSPYREQTNNHSYFQRMINVSSYKQKTFELNIDFVFDKIANEDSPCENINLV